jgi:hypothetical protein
VAQADPEDRDVPQQGCDGLARVGHGLWVTRAVGEEHAGRIPSEDVGGGGGRRHDLDVDPLTEVPQDRALDAEVVGDHERPSAVGQPVGLRGGDLVDEVDAVGARLRLRRREERGLVDDVERTERAGERAELPDLVRRRVSMPAMPGIP